MSLCLGVELGVQTHNSQSLHIYEWNNIAEQMSELFASNNTRRSLYCEGAMSYMMDFKFESEVPVNRLCEITAFMEEMINRLAMRHAKGDIDLFLGSLPAVEGVRLLQAQYWRLHG